MTSNVRRFPMPIKDAAETTVVEVLHEALRLAEDPKENVQGVLVFYVSPLEGDDASESPYFSAGLIRGGKTFSTLIKTLGWLEFLRQDITLNATMAQGEDEDGD